MGQTDCNGRVGDVGFLSTQPCPRTDRQCGDRYDSDPLGPRRRPELLDERFGVGRPPGRRSRGSLGAAARPRRRARQGRAAVRRSTRPRPSRRARSAQVRLRALFHQIRGSVSRAPSRPSHLVRRGAGGDHGSVVRVDDEHLCRLRRTVDSGDKRAISDRVGAATCRPAWSVSAPDISVRERSGDVPEERHHFNVFVNEVLEHRAVYADRLISAQRFGHLLDRADELWLVVEDGRGLPRAKSVLCLGSRHGRPHSRS